MEELLISGLVDKVGLDRATAERVVAFLKENADKLPALLQGDVPKEMLDKLPGGLGGLLGGGRSS
jgi:hypothetical protein